LESRKTLSEEAPSMPTDITENSGQTRDLNINIRAKRGQRDLIDHAAELLGKSRSDFMLETACREAADVLLDRRVFHLDPEAFARFPGCAGRAAG
jgi:uncharacterized protein (DUF1778 family)